MDDYKSHRPVVSVCGYKRGRGIYGSYDGEMIDTKSTYGGMN